MIGWQLLWWETELSLGVVAGFLVLVYMQEGCSGELGFGKVESYLWEVGLVGF